MNWKEKISNKDINGADNLMCPSTMEDDLQRVLLPPIQVNSSQGSMIGSESIRRTSNRQKKSPTTRSEDFFMADVILDSQKSQTYYQTII